MEEIIAVKADTTQEKDIIDDQKYPAADNTIKEVEEVDTETEEDKKEEVRIKKEQDNEKKIVLNLSFSSYPIVEQVAKNEFGYSVSRESDCKWDILWSDSVRTNQIMNLIFIVYCPRKTKCS